jgi:hypothetical protein
LTGECGVFGLEALGEKPHRPTSGAHSAPRGDLVEKG